MKIEEKKIENEIKATEETSRRANGCCRVDSLRCLCPAIVCLPKRMRRTGAEGDEGMKCTIVQFICPRYPNHVTAIMIIPFSCVPLEKSVGAIVAHSRRFSFIVLCIRTILFVDCIACNTTRAKSPVAGICIAQRRCVCVCVRYRFVRQCNKNRE